MLLPTVRIEYVFSDESSSTAVVMQYAPASTTVESLDVIATAMASLLVPLSDAVLVKIRYIWKVSIEDIGVPVPDTAVVDAGAFIFVDVSNQTAGIIIIPDINPDLLVTTGPGSGILIDTTQAPVIAFVDAIIELGACNPFGELFTDIETAYRQSRT